MSRENACYIVFLLTEGKFVISNAGVLYAGLTGNIAEFRPSNSNSWKKYSMKTQYVWNMCNIGSKKDVSLVSSGGIESIECQTSQLPRGTGYRFDGTDITLTGTSITYNTSLNVGKASANGYYIGTSTLGSLGLYKVWLNGSIGGTSLVRITDDGSTAIFYQVKDVDAKGTYIKAVTADTESAYPKNGVSGGYWYEYDKSETVAGDYIETVYSFDPGAYPEDGEKDGYWYTII